MVVEVRYQLYCLSLKVSKHSFVDCQVQIREYSFLSNAKLAPSYWKEGAILEVDERDAMLTDVDIERKYSVLKAQPQIKVLKFLSITNAFSNFENPSKQQNFERILTKFRSVWGQSKEPPGGSIR